MGHSGSGWWGVEMSCHVATGVGPLCTAAAKVRVHVFGHKVISGNVNGPPPFTDVSATEVYTVSRDVIAKARVLYILYATS